MSKFTIKTTPTPTTDDLNTFLDLLSKFYIDNPLTTAFITEIDGVAPDAPFQKLTPERLQKHFSLGLGAAFRSNVLYTTISSPSSQQPLAAVLFEPPDFAGVPPSHARKQPGPVLSEYRGVARAMKAKYLSMPDSGPHMWETPASPSQASGGPSGDPFPSEFNKDTETEVRTFFHLSILVRNVNADRDEVDKAIEELMKVYLDKAKAVDMPILLEAGQEQGKEKMKALGFKILEAVQIGAGKVDERGWPTKNGKGVTVWGMLFSPSS